MENVGDLFNDDLDLLEILDYGFPRNIRDRKNHFEEMDNLTFFRKFRLTKDSFLYLLQLVEEELEYPHDLNQSVSPANQLLIFLRLCATDTHLNAIGDFMGVQPSTVSRITVRVAEVIANKRHVFIKMPTDEDQIKTQNCFYTLARFPRVIGAIDCTHVRIQSPGGDDGEVFRNRKSYFSINVQLVCDPNLRILDVVARWPGSAHDATIFNNSNLKQKFERGEFGNNILIGDSGYPQLPYLFTPHSNPVTRAENLYNESHIRTRNVIERCNGVLKRRFPILAYGSRLKLNTTLTVIVATAILHNIAIDMHEEEPPLPDDLNLEELQYLIDMGNIPDQPQGDEVINYRNNLIQNYFMNL